MSIYNIPPVPNFLKRDLTNIAKRCRFSAIIVGIVVLDSSGPDIIRIHLNEGGMCDEWRPKGPAIQNAYPMD